MKRGFTLLELIVVIIILGILATLGMQQYFRVVEKSRSSEAKMILGHIRDIAGGFYTDHQDLSLFDDGAAGIGTATNLIPGPTNPGDCRVSHYFTYAVSAPGVTTFTATATRCVGAGKEPFGPSAGTVQLVSDFAAVANQDTWAYDTIYQ